VKKFLAIFVTGIIVLTLCISSVGCGEEELPESVDVIDGYVAAQGSIESVEMESEVSMKIVADIPKEEMSIGAMTNMDVNMDMYIASDEKNERMHTVIDMNMAALDEDPTEIKLDMYYLDGWMYVMMDMPMMDPQWMKTDIPYDECLEGLSELDLASSLTEMMEVAHATITGSEKIDGVDCYVVELTPDMDEIWDMVMHQMQMAGTGMSDVPVENFDEMVESFSVKYWIAKDTYYLAKSEMIVKMEITPEAMGVYDEEGSVSLDMNMSLHMFNYNKELSFELPSEAEDAIEESIW
jgi:hypothetical protein